MGDVSFVRSLELELERLERLARLSLLVQRYDPGRGVVYTLLASICDQSTRPLVNDAARAHLATRRVQTTHTH